MVIVYLSMLWGLRRGDRVLDIWAKENGYSIRKRAYISWGEKDQLIQSRDLSIYRVEVIDTDGTKKSGTVEVRLLTRQVEHVTWDDKG